MMPAECFATIITDQWSSRVNFGFSGLRISPDGFKKVADALRSGKIKVVESKDLDDADARYVPDKNLFLIPQYNDNDYVHINEKALVVHEAVHAIIDANKWSKVTQLTGEAAGYLAQVLYRSVSGDRFSKWADAKATTGPMAAIFPSTSTPE
jgi:hypothetical protein